MTDLDSLARAVVLAPDEDTPRLMYADALDERGLLDARDAERAELIRLQIDMVRGGYGPDCRKDGGPCARPGCAFCPAVYRERELLTGSDTVWLPRYLYRLARTNWSRGFVDRLHVTGPVVPADLLWLRDVAAAHPFRVAYTGVPNHSVSAGYHWSVCNVEFHVAGRRCPPWVLRHYLTPYVVEMPVARGNILFQVFRYSTALAAIDAMGAALTAYAHAPVRAPELLKLEET